MAIGAITMILTNVGLQMFNSWRGSKQSAELQQKREEFEQAARERNVEHMMKLMREGQELTLQIEKENHEQRLNDIKGELDNLLQRLTYEMAITNWPLRVLPIVMKNQAFGNLLANQEEKLALHVILTRSNYDKFNNAVLPTVEKTLEQYCNQYWSTMGDHPVLFYSGAWKSRTAPTGSEISSLKTSLNNLPTLLITPLFRPSDGLLVFQVNMWGVGATSTENFAMTELEPTNFQRTFSSKDDYDKDGEVCSEIIEDIVPYLQCLIGYLADTYFWSSTGVAPLLPTLLTNGFVNTDGNKYLIDECEVNYSRLLTTCEALIESNPLEDNNAISLYDGASYIFSEGVKKHHQKTITDIFLNSHSTETVNNTGESSNQYILTPRDEGHLKHIVDSFGINEMSTGQFKDLFMLNKEVETKQTPHINITSRNVLTLVDILEHIARTISEEKICGFDRVNIVLIPKKFMVLYYLCNTEMGQIYPHVWTFFSKHFYLPKTNIKEVNRISLSTNELNNYIIKTKQIMSEKDLEKLFMDSNEPRDSWSTRVLDAFQDVIDSIRQEIKDEKKKQGIQAEVPVLVKTKLEYEDFTNWVRSNTSKNPNYDGVFATIDKSGLFDREKYKMYVCFTINKEPQLGAKAPKVIFMFSKLDDALIDMFGKNKTVQINLNK